MLIPVTGLNIPALSVYSSANEVQLKQISAPEPGLFIAETANVILRAMHAGYHAESLLLDEKFLEPAPPDMNDASMEVRSTVAEILRLAGDIPVYTAPIDVLSGISGFKQTRGVLCAMRRRPLPAVETLLQKATRVAVLEDVENPTNAGALFRSAAGLGFDAVLLTYRSTDPLYRRAARVSMGTVFQIPWTFTGNKHVPWQHSGLPALKAAGFTTAAMALSDRSVFLDDPELRSAEKLAVIFGNEETGLEAETLSQCDYVVKIPMLAGVDSLNVAAAGAVAFWELRDRSRFPGSTV